MSNGKPSVQKRNREIKRFGQMIFRAVSSAALELDETETADELPWKISLPTTSNRSWQHADAAKRGCALGHILHSNGARRAQLRSALATHKPERGSRILCNMVGFHGRPASEKEEGVPLKVKQI